jgi:sRNA-binding regulator protein Hfq
VLVGLLSLQAQKIPPNSTIYVSFLQNGIYVVLLKVDKQKMVYKIEIKH